MTSLLPAVGPSGTDLSRLRRGRIAVYLTFAVAGFYFAAWVPRIPEMKDRLDLSAGSLGLALLAPAVGSLASMPVSGRISARLGSGPATKLFGFFFLAVGWLPGLAGNYATLIVLLFCWGIGIGGMDVAMNAQAVSVEKAYGRPLMSGFHAAWSLGSLLGAGIGTIGAGLHLPIAGQELGVGLALLAAFGVGSRHFVPDPVSADHKSAPTTSAQKMPSAQTATSTTSVASTTSATSVTSATPTTSGTTHTVQTASGGVMGRLRHSLNLRLALLGIAGMAAMLSEGSVADWSGILLRDSFGARAAEVGLGYAAFMATETVGRLLGDRFVHRLGRIRAITIVTTIGVLGLAAGMATATVIGAIVGFALLGIGLSIMVPVAFSSAADGKDQAGPAIATVSAMAYTGFLVGPTTIGFIADATSVESALWLVPVAAAIGGVTAVLALRRPSGTSSPAAG